MFFFIILVSDVGLRWRKSRNQRLSSPSWSSSSARKATIIAVISSIDSRDWGWCKKACILRATHWNEESSERLSEWMWEPIRKKGPLTKLPIYLQSDQSSEIQWLPIEVSLKGGDHQFHTSIGCKNGTLRVTIHLKPTPTAKRVSKSLWRESPDPRNWTELSEWPNQNNTSKSPVNHRG